MFTGNTEDISVVKSLHSMHKALSSSPTTTKKRILPVTRNIIFWDNAQFIYLTYDLKKKSSFSILDGFYFLICFARLHWLELLTPYWTEVIALFLILGGKAFSLPSL
jgi:hypothetical protein